MTQGSRVMAAAEAPSTSGRLPAFWHQIRRSAWTDSKGYTHFDSSRGSWFSFGPRAQYALGAGVFGFGVYYWSSLETVPFTGRRHAILFVSRKGEQELGKHLFEQQCLEARMEGRLLPAHHPYTQVVRKIGARLADVAAQGVGAGSQEHMKGLNWEYAVIDSAVPNAFVVPGGKVVVFTGLIKMLASEAELAAVMAHETAHVLARHHAERMSTLNLWAIARFLSYALFGIGLPNSALYLGIFLPYSRRAEYEADEIGLQLMASACYDPSAAVSMLQKLHHKEQAMEAQSRMSVPGFMRTHPLTDTRVDKVKKDLAQAYKTYSESNCGVVQGFLDVFM